MDKTLKETLGEVREETTDTSQSKPKDTDEGLSKGDSDTSSGETEEPSTEVEKEYVRGIDISDVPEADRPRIRKALEEKAANLEKGYQPKFQEVAELKRALEDFERRGISLKEAQEAIDDFAYRKRNPQQKKDADRYLYSLIKEAPLEQKESLKNLRRIIKEETSDVSALKKELKEVRDQLGLVAQSHVSTRVKTLNTELDSLTKEYGAELIEKHRSTILKHGQNYDTSAEDLLFAVAPKEVKEHYTAKKPRVLTKEKKNAISSEGSGITSGKEQIDVKNRSLKQILTDLTKK